MKSLNLEDTLSKLADGLALNVLDTEGTLSDVSMDGLEPDAPDTEDAVTAEFYSMAANVVGPSDTVGQIADPNRVLRDALMTDGVAAGFVERTRKVGGCGRRCL